MATAWCSGTTLTPLYLPSTNDSHDFYAYRLLLAWLVPGDLSHSSVRFPPTHTNVDIRLTSPPTMQFRYMLLPVYSPRVTRRETCLLFVQIRYTKSILYIGVIAISLKRVLPYYVSKIIILCSNISGRKCVVVGEYSLSTFFAVVLIGSLFNDAFQ
jgi:hypothetical protein